MAITNNSAISTILSLLKKIYSLSEKDRELLISILNRNLSNDIKDNEHHCTLH